MNITKENSQSIRVSMQYVVNGEVVTNESVMTYKYLVDQKRAIEDQMARELEQRNAELAQVNSLLESCASLGIPEPEAVDAPVQPVMAGDVTLDESGEIGE